MSKPLSRQEFTSFVVRAGLSCSEEELDEFFEAYGHLETMMKRLRSAPRSIMNEPAMTFAHPLETLS